MHPPAGFSGEIEPGCIVQIGASGYQHSGQLRLSRGARVMIGDDCNLGNIDIYAVGGTIIIGPWCSFNGRIRIFSHEGCDIEIGSHCLFADNVLVTASDMHSIVSAVDGMRVNPPAPIRLGQRVWVGEGAYVFKGVEIGDGSIIGAASVVTRSVPARCLAAGNPAKVIKQDVTWDFRLLPCREREMA
jgi:acetyltransferase-like isoleucine patch superfamily enzyme